MDLQRELIEQVRQLPPMGQQQLRAWLEQYARGGHAAASHGSTLYQELLSRGVLGMIEGGPSDLATHKRHLDGLGRD